VGLQVDREVLIKSIVSIAWGNVSEYYKANRVEGASKKDFFYCYFTFTVSGYRFNFKMEL
jgi:hypothetical protein